MDPWKDEEAKEAFIEKYSKEYLEFQDEYNKDRADAAAEFQWELDTDR